MEDKRIISDPKQYDCPSPYDPPNSYDCFLSCPDLENSNWPMFRGFFFSSQDPTAILLTRFEWENKLRLSMEIERIFSPEKVLWQFRAKRLFIAGKKSFKPICEWSIYTPYDIVQFCNCSKIVCTLYVCNALINHFLSLLSLLSFLLSIYRTDWT